MFRNYLAAALRNLARNRLYAGITIVGLAIGFAAAMLIGLYVRDELTYDRFIPGHERVYQVTETLMPGGSKPIEASDTPMMLARPLTLDFPRGRGGRAPVAVLLPAHGAARRLHGHRAERLLGRSRACSGSCRCPSGGRPRARRWRRRTAW